MVIVGEKRLYENGGKTEGKSWGGGRRERRVNEIT